MNADQPSLGMHVPEFRTEYICLKCCRIFDKRYESCPRCGGPICPRILRVYGGYVRLSVTPNPEDKPRVSRHR